MRDDPLRSSSSPRTSSVSLLVRQILHTKFDGDQIRAWTLEIGRELLSSSPHVREPNFKAVHPDDLQLLFSAYDRRFLNGLARRVLDERGTLTFRLSRRMTRSGGLTTRRPRPEGGVDFEIAVATSILFDGFRVGDPDVTVGGLPCANRLEALQRVFEHELVHLAEFLCTGNSNCSARPFQNIARRLFLHRAHTHQLITRVDRAAQMGITVGSRVTFLAGGRRLAGRVNRITRRATVLVKRRRGDLYSDGHRYEKYYVPLSALELTGQPRVILAPAGTGPVCAPQ